jgi:hypothetical protein
MEVRLHGGGIPGNHGLGFLVSVVDPIPARMSWLGGGDFVFLNSMSWFDETENDQLLWDPLGVACMVP